MKDKYQIELKVATDKLNTFMSSDSDKANVIKKIQNEMMHLEGKVFLLDS